MATLQEKVYRHLQMWGWQFLEETLRQDLAPDERANLAYPWIGGNPHPDSRENRLKGQIDSNQWWQAEARKEVVPALVEILVQILSTQKAHPMAVQLRGVDMFRGICPAPQRPSAWMAPQLHS